MINKILLYLFLLTFICSISTTAQDINDIKVNYNFVIIKMPHVTDLACLDRNNEIKTAGTITNYLASFNPGQDFLDGFIKGMDSIKRIDNGVGVLCGDDKGYDIELNIFRSDTNKIKIWFACSNFIEADLEWNGTYIGKLAIKDDYKGELVKYYELWNKVYYGWSDKKDCMGLKLKKKKNR